MTQMRTAYKHAVLSEYTFLAHEIKDLSQPIPVFYLTLHTIFVVLAPKQTSTSAPVKLRKNKIN